ncbi:MAG TPA: cyclic nucleotide-binding domain-containing protein [Polyangiaceae bacterium]|nr:cyclic nucleotide-binding domain-containing protein [Polyangiaceae bacterium]
MTRSEEDGDEPPIGSSAKRYRWLGEVNRGGMGIIHGARDPVIGRRVAIKVLRPELEHDDRVLDEFAQEAQVTGQLDHPNIVPIYDFGTGDNSPFMVMKWVAGKSLAQLLRSARQAGHGPDQLKTFVHITLRMCDALSFAHSRGVVHCDLKPENVMVGDHGQVYLMDWGMALVRSGLNGAARPPDDAAAAAATRAEGGTDSLVTTAAGVEGRAGQARGTPAYMAPEQVFGLVDEIDERTDVFGVGGVLCEILLGEPPNNQRTLLGSGTPGRHWRPPSDSPMWSQLPPELCRIASKALAPKREDRYSSIAALRADLEQFLDGGGWFETRTYPAGEAIVSEGEPGDTAYIIERGTCEVFRVVDGERALIRRLEPGDVFGEMAVFTGGTRTATVVAACDVTVKVITGASLNRELDRNPWVAAFVRSLARMLRESGERSSRPPRPL